ncbi:MAG: glycosyltransferase [Symploca sp. SIO2C1]|nr:glycosyltransferase [Symploca sp. SIO2C1]
MSDKPILSIVTPTRGNFTNYWFEQLIAVKGDIEFILVYPPGVSKHPIVDPRFKVITSQFKGLVVQRSTGLLSASGLYTLTLDDDDYVHPDVLQLVCEYFTSFPDSWVLRLMMAKIDFTDEERIRHPWEPIPNLKQLDIAPRRQNDKPILQTLPIAPLNNRFDLRLLTGAYIRRDMSGPHIENFNNKVWKTELVQQALTDLADVMKINGSLYWIPSWNLDRLLGLFIQAKFFEEDKIVGHWMPLPEQIRYIVRPHHLKEFRLHFPSDALLAKRFPQYGYFWNLFFDKFWTALRQLYQRYIVSKRNPN